MEHIPADRITWDQSYSGNFTGQVAMARLSEAVESGLLVLAVRFAAGAHNGWHRHPEGQVLYVVEGTGVVATKEGGVIRIGAGDVVNALPGEIHWHGAVADESMTHLSLTTGGPTEWLPDLLTDDEYQTALEQG